MEELRNKVEADIILIAFDTNKSAKFLNDNPGEYLRFLKTQKLIKRIRKLINNIESKNFKKSTLGGCLFTIKKDQIFVI